MKGASSFRNTLAEFQNLSKSSTSAGFFLSFPNPPLIVSSMMNSPRSGIFFLLMLLGLCGRDLVAATKEEYLKANDNWVSQDMTGRTKGMCDKVLAASNPPADGKYILCGRGEFANVLPIAYSGIYRLQTGDQEGGKKQLQNALEIVRTANKVTVDGYDENKLEDGTSRGQLSFVLWAMIDACRLLKEQGVLVGDDLQRARTMIENVVDYRIKVRPQLGTGGLSNHVNNYGWGGLSAAKFLQEEFRSDPAFAASRPDLPAKIDKMMKWSSMPLRSGMNYPWHFHLREDGSISKPLKPPGRGVSDSEALLHEEPAPDQAPRIGISENSSGYDALSIYMLLRMLEEMPPDQVPEITDARRKEMCDWMMDWSRHIMPVGVVPQFGDSEWGATDFWIGSFESAARQFKDPKYGDAAAHFRDCADRMFRYGKDIAGGHLCENLTVAIPVADESIKPAGIQFGSAIVRQQSPNGEWIPSKVILRGESSKPEEQPFAMFNTFYNGSHSHPEVGALVTYGSSGSVYLHELSYDAGPVFFHNLFLVRPANEPFLPFCKVYKDPNHTVIQKGQTGLDGNWVKLISADLSEAKGFSYSKIVTQIGFGRFHSGFLQTREAVLEKKSGILIVFDTVTNTQDFGNNAVPYAGGPLWHVQNVLSKSPEGYLCQDDVQAIFGPTSPKPIKIASPARPVWIGMAGPSGSTLGFEEWHFVARHERSDIPPKSHLFLRSEGKTEKGASFSTISVFVPMPVGTTSIETSPAQAKVDDSGGTVTIGQRSYKFGKANGDSIAVSLSGKDESGNDCSATIPKTP